MILKLFLVFNFLATGSLAIDFITIGQKEIVDYIKNRADLLHGTNLNERNLQDLLSNAVFTGLEEETLTFAFGESMPTVNSESSADQVNDLLSRLTKLTVDSNQQSGPLRIVLTSDMMGTTSIASGERSTSKSASSKSSAGDFTVNCVQKDHSDSTHLDGSITIGLGGSNAAHNLTLSKTIYLAAQVNVTLLGSSDSWSTVSLPELADEGRLLSLLTSSSGSLYLVSYQSLIRETIQSKEGNRLSGIKTSGSVLVLRDSNGLISLSGRTISGKIEPTLESEAEELVDSFLSTDGSKSRSLANLEIRPNLLISKFYNRHLSGSRRKGSNFFGRFDCKFNHHAEEDNHEDPHPHLYGNRHHLGSRSRHENRKNFRDFIRWFRQNRHRGTDEDHEVPSWPDQIGRPTRKPDEESIYKDTVVTTSQPHRTSAPTTPSTTPRPVRRQTLTTSSPSTAVTTTTRPTSPSTTTPVPKPPSTMETVVTQPPSTESPVTIKPTLTEPKLPQLPKGATVSVWTTSIVQ